MTPDRAKNIIATLARPSSPQENLAEELLFLGAVGQLQDHQINCILSTFELVQLIPNLASSFIDNLSQSISTEK